MKVLKQCGIVRIATMSSQFVIMIKKITNKDNGLFVAIFKATS